MFRLDGLFGYKSAQLLTSYGVHILHKEQRPSLVVFSSRLSRKEIINQDNHTPQGENNEYNSRPCSPITISPPFFLPNPYLIPTQPEPDPSLAYVAAYIPSTHSLTADKNSDPFKWYPVVLRRWRCTAWFVQKPCGCPKREASARWYHGRTAWTCIHIHTHTKSSRCSTTVHRDNVRCTANQPAVRQGERAEGLKLIMRRTDLGTTTCICCYSWVL